jgi:hypothetical protein
MSPLLPFLSKISPNIKKRTGIVLTLASILLLSSVSVAQTNYSGLKAFAQPDSTITINAGFAHFSYGLVLIGGEVQDVDPGANTIDIQVYNPDRELILDQEMQLSIYGTTGGFGNAYFGVKRQYVYESYSIIATYNGKSVTKIMPPYSSEFAQPPVISVEDLRIYANGEVTTSGRGWGGIAGENLTISVYPASGDSQLLGSTTTMLALHVQFGGVVDTGRGLQIGNNYKVVYHLEGTDVTAERTFTFTGTDQALLRVQAAVNAGSLDYMPIKEEVILYDQEGNKLQSNLSPAEFLLTTGEQYLVEATDSDEYVFSSWWDTGSTDRVRPVSITYSTYLTANYRNTSESAEPDFSISVNPTSIEVPAADGGLASATLTITSFNGFNSEVTLTPSVIEETSTSVDSSVTPAPDGSATATAAVYSTSSAKPGTYYLVVTAKSGPIYHYVTLTVTITPASDSESKLTLRTKDSRSGEILGYYTALFKDGSVMGTGFSPTIFTLNNNEDYVVQVQDYGQYVFDHWEDIDSNARDRPISISSDTSIIAIYRNVNEPATPPPDTGQSSITVRTIDAATHNQIYGYYTVLFDGNGSVLRTGFSPVTFDVTSGQDYMIQVQDYDSYYFNYWQDNDNADRDRTFTATNDGITLTAVYGTSPSGGDNKEQPPQGSDGKISVTTVDSSGNQIYGYYTTLSQNGNLLQTAFSPAEFTVNGGQIYQTAVADYGSYVFDHWIDGRYDRFHDTNAGDGLTAVYRDQ